jgi:hypothetical protein
MNMNFDYNNKVHREKLAAEEAKRILKERGITFPVLTGSSLQEGYDKLKEYSQLEAALIVEILRRPIGGDRPLAMDNTNQCRENWYDK